MAAKFIFSALAGSFAIVYTCDVAIADHKIFGGKLLHIQLNYFSLLDHFPPNPVSIMLFLPFL